ncbi:MAG: sigma-54-dependent Fis family transcriptional regulator [Lentisphaerae bacterium]|nr:sigma-54-dependent Fis family transcriptional regulator [Lentisphaerota bacterium]MBT4822689.1 sigma-54-dependent Fis family transcriptional regulator [Lentisphaerota bacterium]MBT5604444.1 sigma-54-dependent Fis family transcriptional regulator [Lentisphaerota bacterium]MBT7058201.1 sigma-54-dependent Fis family transcriptional regulator [Lentisphaerota bacterium]MBT7847415.1 sigma-54-dependent Fis family transcriptional regulator [Lentisphaerota bacterium]
MNADVYPDYPILVVDDEIEALDSFEMSLCSHGINNTLTCNDSREVMAQVRKQRLSAVLLDLAMPHATGDELLRQITCDFPELPVIVITGFNDVTRAVDCMRHGAFDYMVKPVEGSRLSSGVRRALEFSELRQENDSLREGLLAGKLTGREAFGDIVTGNRSMHAIFTYVEAIARTQQCVLITGETGVGKELIARAIHRSSERGGAWVAANVASLDDQMFSDALFGHTSGAFTGATGTRPGLIDRASGGTLLLDEIGDLSPSCQAKLLRLLQEREYFPLGADVPHQSTARIVVSTNRDLVSLQEEGEFRSDLLYRLRSHHVHVPPLRERLDDDLARLLDHFLVKAACAQRKRRPASPKELLPLLRTYDFPGNVRELELMVFDAVSRHERGSLALSSFREHISRSRPGHAPRIQSPPAGRHGVQFPSPLPTIKGTTQLLIDEAMARAHGKQSLAAMMLGITPQALSQRLRKSRAEKRG